MIKEMTEKEYNFFFLMGKFFASRKFIKEMDCQLYSNEDMLWYIYFNKEAKICGFASLEDNEKYSMLDNFLVLEEYRNKGIGKEILDHIVNDVMEKDIRLISRNPIAIKMFKERGFEITGHNGRYEKMIKKIK